MHDGKNRKHAIAFIIPPPGDVAMPMLGAYVLNHYLKKHGVKSQVFDFSVIFYNNARLKNKFNKCLALSNVEIPNVDYLLDYKNESKDRISELILSEGLLNKLQNNCVFSAGLVSFENNSNSHEKIVECVENLTIFEPLIEEELKSICKSGCSIIGLSVSFSSQLPFALLIAKLIKKYNSKINVVFGGSLFDPKNDEYKYLSDPGLSVDKVIAGPGENALLSLCLCVDEPYEVIECIPDFSDVKWEQYYTDSDTRCMPFSFRTSCYYGKCRFCNGDDISGIRKLDDNTINVTMRALRKIVAKHRITHVYFTDAAILPRELLKISKLIGNAFRWGINARADKGLTDILPQLASNGCSMLRIGFESGSQNVLDAMLKGTNIDEYNRFLSVAKQCGIRVHAYIMFGFPGETDEDRDTTIKFLANNRDRIYSYSLSIFNAYAGTAIYDRLVEQYGEQYNGDVDINMLYYNEQKYNNIIKYTDSADAVMSGSQTNKYCYGGRVFMDNPSIESIKLDGKILSIIQNR